MADNPITRKEKYLAKLTGNYAGNVPDPITRVEKYLYDLCQKGVSGLTPEEIENAVNKYLKENPVQPGATTEQAQQIEQNKTDIASLKKETGSLKGDISTKIAKFYASSQGETHLADSDNGKIMDMMLYGKSEQKQYSGKNLLNATLQTTTQNGVTCTANGDGTYTINGTATSDTLFHIGYFIFEKDTKYKIVGCPQGGSLNTLYRLDGSLNANSDTGNGIVYSGDGNKRNARIVVFNGATVNNLLFKPMITTDLTATYDDFEPYHEQTVTLPYTLNAIPVESGGNVTIDGQQYIADYVDVERGKLVRMVYVLDASANADIFRNYWEGETDGKQYLIRTDFASPPFPIEENAQTWCNKYNLLSNNFEYTRFDGCLGKKSCVYIGNPRSIQIYLSLYNQKLSTIKEQREWLKNNQTYIYVPLNTPEEADLTTEEIAAFKALVTYYPVTNISVNSEQLDGYTVFNYPISMENGWNYVKQQIGDTRDYIYDMDARTQDTDLQAAEAYVNSEYAVALTELEV